MDDSWKRKIDTFKAEQERLRIEKEKAEKETEEKRRRELHDQKVRELGKKFQCCVCGKKSIKPYKDHVCGDRESPGYDYDNWNIPGDLFLCDLCKQRACSEHFYNGFCKKCAEKL